MTTNTTINEDETIYSTDDGNDGRGGLQWGNGQARYETSDNEAHAQVKASLVGLGINAWARVWSEIEVEEGSGGDSTSKADFVISGEYDGVVDALGGAASDMWVDLFVRDLSDIINMTIYSTLDLPELMKLMFSGNN